MTDTGVDFAALAGVDLGSLSGQETVDHLEAVYRLYNRVGGLLLAAFCETGIAEQAWSTDRVRRPDFDFGADEARAALVLTRTAAEAWLWLGWDLRTRLPAVQAAVLSGVLDLPRARILSEWTAELPDGAARGLVEFLLPRAHTRTTGQLIDEIKRLAVAIDPDWARRRYESKLTGRKVIAHRNPDGTANIGGYDLPVERVAAAAARVDRLAKAARRAGHPDVLQHLRADLYLGLLDGEYEAMSDTQILADLIANGEQKKTAKAAAAAEGGDETAAGGEGASPADPNDQPTTRDEPPDDPIMPAGRGIEVRVRLTTILGLDQLPGELAGWGALHPELATQLVGDNTGGQWRFVITDQDSYPMHTGLLRTRPADATRQGAGTVEIQVQAHVLEQLATENHPDWQQIIAELVEHLREAKARDGDRDKRAPGPGLRRFLEARHRTCVFPGCRVPSRHTDMDHSHEHGRGGKTLEDNLAPICRHDHQLRDHGWKLSHPQPGHIVWTSPLGKTYQVRPKPVITPTPDPVPPSNKPTYDLTTPDNPHNQHTLEPAAQPEAPRPPPPTTVDKDEEPPF